MIRLCSILQRLLQSSKSADATQTTLVQSVCITGDALWLQDLGVDEGEPGAIGDCAKEDGEEAGWHYNPRSQDERVAERSDEGGGRCR